MQELMLNLTTLEMNCPKLDAHLVIKILVTTDSQNLDVEKTFPALFTCNGYDSQVFKWEYDIVVNGQVEQLPIDKMTVYLSFLNGDMSEINTGTVTSGRCAGDVLFVFKVYVTDDQEGCANGKGVDSLTACYYFVHLTGPKCGTNTCTLESARFPIDPPFLYILLMFLIMINAVPIDQHLNQPVFNGTKWVVLVAGADGWPNYASQSSVYHAYQFFHANGIPNENIIVFHPNDIAHNMANPTPGIVIDHPNGTDVYHGVPLDYTGFYDRAMMFKSVLNGSSDLINEGRKVLNSGPNDHVFIYFIGHGGPDLILFQEGDDYLYGDDLIKLLKLMHQNKRYKKLVFYLESCDSGSMFKDQLPADINVYAITSSMWNQNSAMMYYDKRYKTMIGSFFAHYWLLNSEQAALNNETLQQQFDYIYKWTNTPGQVDAENFTQQAQQYGDVSIAKLPVSDFTEMCQYTEELESLLKGRQSVDKHITDYVNSIQHLLTVDSNAILNTKQELNNRQCYRHLNPYVLGKLYIFVNICEEMRESSDADINAVNQLLIQYCQQNVENSQTIQ
ncbi:unnamed protein product [Medioppia subpectinata]|uniref:Legumain n=1 Tax=Medioppia subpectinata TaxID=1979941 RepID=A0A7R9KNF6_9ACAR|nr:unnamed protein product [Medioppia subpectinata]CAG2105652.1 unnamed protein product [Medioppia subpectinata]